MRTATWRGGARFTLDEVPDPRPGPGQAVVAVHAAGICGTDVHATQGLFPWTPPLVMGHEYTGVVQHVGRGVSRRLIGRAVACEPSYGCGTCHVIPGVRGARGHVGPPLTDFALRQYIAGAVPNEPAMLVRWIQNPQSIEPGTVMPPLGVNDADARHIAAYLYTLGAGRGLGPPHLFPERVLHP